MSEETKKVQAEETEESKELDLDELEEVTGGALRDVAKKRTSSISSNTRSKI